MNVKKIPLDKIVVEDIDPFFPSNQIVEKEYFPEGITVILYYHFKQDSMKVKIKKDKETLYDEKGARGTFNHVVESINEMIDEGVTWN